MRQGHRHPSGFTWLGALGLWTGLAVAQGQPAAPPVEVELVVPPAETYVIGDAVPLYWRFRNQASEPLAFMWEGCCRLNGRLTVTRAGASLEPIPPGQALAHMFAKAERLDPGKARDFDTRLSDWVRLTETGTYQLQGRYTGVLPDQRPQVPKSLRLWREAAETPPIHVALLGVEDYWKQRSDREQRRGLRAEISLAVPDGLIPPLVSLPLKVRVSNLSPIPQAITWPDSFSLWLVTGDGDRVALSSSAIDATYEAITLPAGESLEREIPFGSDRLEGEPLGRYRLFVDLRSEGPERPRLPSNVLHLQWRLGTAETQDLLARAAQGPGTGGRNAALKLLRVYLAELRGALNQLPETQVAPPAVALLQQLRRAACLKGVAPKPGRVDLALQLARDGALSFDNPRLADCLEGHESGITNQVAMLLGVRRHLGWEIGLICLPDPATPVRQLSQAETVWRGFASEWAGPLRVMPALSTNPAAGALVPGPPPHQRDLSLALVREGNELALRAWWPSTTAKASGAASVPDSDDWTQWGKVRFAGGLEELLTNPQRAVTQVSLRVQEDLDFAAVFGTVAPCLARGLQVHLGLLPR